MNKISIIFAISLLIILLSSSMCLMLNNDSIVISRESGITKAIYKNNIIISDTSTEFVINSVLVSYKDIVLRGDLGEIKNKINLLTDTNILFDSVVITAKDATIFEANNVRNVDLSGNIIVNADNVVILSQIDSKNINWVADTVVYGSGRPLFNGWKGTNIEISNIKAIRFNGNAIFMNAGNDIYIHNINLNLIGTFPESVDAIIMVHSNQPETISNWKIEDIVIDGTYSGDEKAVAIAVNGNRAPPWGYDVSVKNVYIKNYYMDGLDVINLYGSVVDNFNYDNGVVGGIFVCSDKTIISNSKVTNTVGSGFGFGDPGCPGRSYSDFRLVDSKVTNSGYAFVTAPSENTKVSNIEINNLDESNNEYSLWMGKDTFYGYILGNTYDVKIKNTNLKSPVYFGDKVTQIKVMSTSSDKTKPITVPSALSRIWDSITNWLSSWSS